MHALQMRVQQGLYLVSRQVVELTVHDLLLF